MGWVKGRMWRHPRDHPAHPSIPQDTGLASTSLRTLTERLQELAQGIQSLVQGELPAGDAPQPPSLTLLARVIDLVGAAKELFSWLNRSGAGEGTHGCWVPPTLGAQLYVFPPGTSSPPSTTFRPAGTSSSSVPSWQRRCRR